MQFFFDNLYRKILLNIKRVFDTQIVKFILQFKENPKNPLTLYKSIKKLFVQLFSTIQMLQKPIKYHSAIFQLLDVAP